jgi:hypothetical protein
LMTPEQEDWEKKAKESANYNAIRGLGLTEHDGGFPNVPAAFCLPSSTLINAAIEMDGNSNSPPLDVARPISRKKVDKDENDDMGVSIHSSACASTTYTKPVASGRKRKFTATEVARADDCADTETGAVSKMEQLDQIGNGIHYSNLGGSVVDTMEYAHSSCDDQHGSGGVGYRTGDASQRRAKNTEAARRSRARKQAKLETLEADVKRLEADKNGLLLKLAVLENETKGGAYRESMLVKRVAELERMLQIRL